MQYHCKYHYSCEPDKYKVARGLKIYNRSAIYRKVVWNFNEIFVEKIQRDRQEMEVITQDKKENVDNRNNKEKRQKRKQEQVRRKK